MNDSTIEVELTVRDGQNNDEQTVIVQRELKLGDSINTNIGELIDKAANRINDKRKQKYHIGIDGKVTDAELERVREQFKEVADK